VVVQRGVNGVAETVVEGEGRGDFPAILRENVVEESVRLNLGTGALRVAARIADEEVDQRVAGGVEGVGREAVAAAVVGIEGVGDVEAAAVIAEFQIVMADDLGEGFIDLKPSSKAPETLMVGTLAAAAF
jgi:hypothetical protein